MHKSIILSLFILVTTFSFGQEINKYFAQAHFRTDDVALIKDVEESIRAQAGIWMVRIDPTNGNVLIFTGELPYLTEEELLNLFGDYADLIACPYIGIVRVDEIKTFPFDSCE
ncbi:MAG: hypothetical protein QNK70_03115 [Crocinitomicaceae bacterium]